MSTAAVVCILHNHADLQAVLFFFLCFFDINLHPWAFLQFPYYRVCRHCSFSSLWLKAQAPGDARLAVWNGAGREPKREAKREKQGENWSRGRRSSVTKS